MKKIYIAGKISGECETPELMEKCKEKFYSYSGKNKDVEQLYSKESIFYFNENEFIWYSNGLYINRYFIPSGITWEQCIKNCIKVLISCDEIHMLPDWKESKGATIEHRLALDLGIKIVYA